MPFESIQALFDSSESDSQSGYKTPSRHSNAFRKSVDGPHDKNMCYKCNRSFSTPVTLRGHMSKMHCMSLMDAEEYVEFQREGGAPRKPRFYNPVTCQECNIIFIRPTRLRTHYVRMHQISADDLKHLVPNVIRRKRSTDNRVISAVECYSCKDAFTRLPTLFAHFYGMHVPIVPVKYKKIKEARSLSRADEAAPGHHFIQQWTCYVCKKPLPTKCRVRIHLERFHPAENSRSTIKIKKVLQPQLRKCHICQRTFRHEFKLEDHLQQAHGSDDSRAASANKSSHPCNHCEMVFQRAAQLKEHIKSLRNGRAIMCRKCYTGFDSRLDLNQHMEQNGKCKKLRSTKTALCTYCGETFVSKWAMQVHMRRHLNVRPFECDKCDLKFSTRLQLQRHEPKHAKEHEWFLCPVDGCGKSYSQMCHLKYHEKQKHSEPTFKCSHCQKMFTTERYRSYERKNFTLDCINPNIDGSIFLFTEHMHGDILRKSHTNATSASGLLCENPRFMLIEERIRNCFHINAKFA